MKLMRQRPGVTIMEVLSAAMILVISLVGVSMALTQALRKSSKPAQVEVATAFAAERLHYFRSQQDPFRAAGGTHYIYKDTDPVLYNNQPGCNNVFNNTPQLFVREFLYDTTAGTNINNAAGTDQGLTNQRRRTLIGGATALNQIAPTPVVNRVFPSRDGYNAPGTAIPFAGLTGALAPRANPTFPNAVNAIIPADIRYVREVWVQTNHPPMIDALIGNPALVVAPTLARNLPLYTVAVTVKVFARDPATKDFDPAPAGGQVQYRNNAFRGPGYDPTRPLAQMTGYFGVHRMLN